MTDYEARDGAIKIYGNDMADEFPVLKAFQQYIDAEQAKMRKRTMLLCIFFSFVLTIVIAVFVGLLLVSSSRNQTLNDRLIEFVMKERERQQVVTQPPSAQQDDKAIQMLAGRLEEFQKALIQTKDAEKKAAEETAKAKERLTAESLEIERLKTLLAVEKEKVAAEREKQRQAELEAYRRKHYPELYESKPKTDVRRKRTPSAEEIEADREIESIVKDVEIVEAITYFDEDSDDEKPVKKSTKKKSQKENIVPVEEDDVTVPDSVKDSFGNIWNIPEE